MGGIIRLESDSWRWFRQSLATRLVKLEVSSGVRHTLIYWSSRRGLNCTRPDLVTGLPSAL